MLSPHLFNIVLEVLAGIIRQNKQKEKHAFRWMAENNPSLFTDDMIFMWKILRKAVRTKQ